MELSDKVKGIVASAVIDALGGSGSEIVREMTNEILDRRITKDGYDPDSDPYGIYGMSLRRGGTIETIPYVEYLARCEIEQGVKDEIARWFKSVRGDLKDTFADRIDADKMADGYIKRLGELFEEGVFEVSAKVEITDREEDY